jgi:hypothetical protein
MKILWEKNARKVHLGHMSGQVWLHNDSMYLLPHESRRAFVGFQSITKTQKLLGGPAKSIQSWSPTLWKLSSSSRNVTLDENYSLYIYIAEAPPSKTTNDLWPKSNVNQSRHHPVTCSLTWQVESKWPIWCCHVYMLPHSSCLYILPSTTR